MKEGYERRVWKKVMNKGHERWLVKNVKKKGYEKKTWKKVMKGFESWSWRKPMRVKKTNES